MNCPDPILSAVLADYWLSALAGPEEETVELHLLQCDSCAARLRETIAFSEGVRHLARSGSLRMVVSDSLLRRAAAQGLRIREYSIPPGGEVQCTVTAEDHLLVARMAADLAGAHRVDLNLCDERGAEQLRLPDIPFRSGAREVIYQESITYAKSLPSGKLIVRLVAFDAAGRERVLGEYSFNHTRALP